MLSGKMPFYGRDDAECLRRIAAGSYQFPDREWSQISDGAISLVKALLQVDPEKRLTANAALQHQWLADPAELSDAPIPNDLSGIHSSRRKFKKAVMAVATVERMKDLMKSTQKHSPTSASEGAKASDCQ
jgi:calcium-dependent protein kinase